MDVKTLISKLNWFYSLELNQVDLYNAQSKAFKGRYSGIVLERCAFIEQNHVDNIGEKIKELGAKPTVLGDIISPILGKTAGELSAMTGLENTLAIDILIEQKAMKDYNDLLNKLYQENYGDEELLKILQHNFVDEHIHTEWFRTKIIALKQYEFTAKHFSSSTKMQTPNQVIDGFLNNHSRTNLKRAKLIKPRPLKTVDW
ncbi:ferritin-like domain-containing protein [Desulfosporosinus sp. PR]|uniref:ferritin-like domain-containing protein n=1 Tax=Candidatus Desulfosporosinus nitrosoreducens TaxID=3401928 RepID=UPI0027EA50D7|nr:ferritin-like domain-containing protein [Desulfosporosinus sp. PR]MDQ7097097.1 ferritin-like domain-containing protein [Desulfosporosinus sp. PR]